MNFLEAIRSGKRFKRRHTEDWLSCENDTRSILFPDGNEMDVHHPSNWDSIMFCDDWEVEEDMITISRKQLHTALNTSSLIEGHLNSEGSRLRTKQVWDRLIWEITNVPT